MGCKISLFEPGGKQKHKQMKSFKNNSLKGQTYEAPQMEIIVIEPQGVLCGSGRDAATSTAGAGVQARI